MRIDREEQDRQINEMNKAINNLEKHIKLATDGPLQNALLDYLNELKDIAPARELNSFSYLELEELGRGDIAGIQVRDEYGKDYYLAGVNGNQYLLIDTQVSRFVWTEGKRYYVTGKLYYFGIVGEEEEE